MKILKQISIHLLFFMVFILPVLTLAQQGTQTGNTPTQSSISNIRIDNPFKGGNDLMSLITTILQNIVMPIAAVAVVMYIIYAGFTFVTAQGKPTEIEKAKERLLWSLVGAGILLGAAGIAEVVKNTVKDFVNY